MRGVKLIFTNESRGHMIGEEFIKLADSTLGEDATLGDIYRMAQREGFGRCQSKVYQDIATAGAKHVGYFFVSRQQYEDSHEPYTRGVWVMVGEYRPAVREGVI